jgi:hypothetical protein
LLVVGYDQSHVGCPLFVAGTIDYPSNLFVACIDNQLKILIGCGWKLLVILMINRMLPLVVHH